MTDREKARMLENIFSTPIESPYYRMRAVFASALIFVISFGGAIYASEVSVPGDLFYPIKINVVEPVLTVVNFRPEEKIVWEEKKVIRRIEEAEALLLENKLDDNRMEELERRIEKSSKAFTKAVKDKGEDEEKVEDRKDEFRKKVGKQKMKEDDKSKTKEVENGSKVEKLRKTAIEAVNKDSEKD